MDGTTLAARYLALTKREPDSLSWLSEDVRWHVPGESRVSGDYTGRDDVAALFERLAELSDGTFAVIFDPGADVVDLGDRVVLWQRATASHNGTALDDQQCLRFSVTGGRVGEAWLSPGDGRAHDRFWGTLPRLLSPADEDALANVIGRATAKGSPSLWSTAGTVALATLIVAGLVGGYKWLTSWRPPVSMSYTGGDATHPSQLAFAGSPAVRWTVASAFVRSMQVAGPDSDVVEVELPLPPSSCADVATALGTQCIAGRVVQGTPLSLRWDGSVPVALTADDGIKSAALAVTVVPAQGQAATVPSVTIDATTASTTEHWCFSDPATAVQLSVQRGANHFEHGFQALGPHVRCGDGLVLVVGTAPVTNARAPLPAKA